MATRNAVAHSMIAHDALYRRSPLLDQFSEGLKEMGIMELIKVFPIEMSPLFIATGEVSLEEVLEAIWVKNESDISAADKFTVHLFQRYVKTLDDPS